MRYLKELKNGLNHNREKMIDIGHKGKRYVIDNREAEYLILDLFSDLKKQINENEKLFSFIKGHNIKTTNIKPSIPIRIFDWEAIRSDYCEGDAIGYGKTELKAIKDLIKKELHK
jgi:hypothetical protein